MQFTDYSNQVIDGKMCIWLQSYGWQPAKLGKDLKEGDIIVYNCGYTGKIQKIERQTEKSIFVTILENGKEYNNIKIGKNTYKPVKGA
jgi:preprotein translocase subunit YajC